MQFWTRLGQLITRRSGTVIGIAIALTVVAAFGLPRLEFATGQDSYLNQGTQVYEDNEQYQSLFGGQAMITLFTADEGNTVADLFNPENNARMRALAAEIEADEGVLSVITPITALEFTAAMVAPREGDDPLSSVAAGVLLGAVGAAEQAGDAASAEARLTDSFTTLGRINAIAPQDRTVDNPEWAEFLLVDNSGNIRAALRPFFPAAPGGDNSLEESRNAQMITRLVGNASIEQEGDAAVTVTEATAATDIDGFTLLSAGAPVLLKDINDYLQEGMLTLGGIALLVMLVILAVAFRVRTRLLALGVVIVAIIWTFGLLGLIGFELSLVTIAGLPILIGMGIDFAIQIHNRFEEELLVDRSDDPAGTTLRWLGPPLLVALVAAIIAFLSMQISALPMVRSFGVMLAIGITIMLVAGVAVTLAVLAGRERRKPSVPRTPGRSATEWLVVRLGSLPRAAAVPLAVLAVALFTFGIVAEDAFEIESDPRRWVDQSSAVVGDLNELAAQTGSTSELGIYIEGPDVLDQDVVTFATELAVSSLDDYDGRLLTASSIYTTTYYLMDVAGAEPVLPTAEDVAATLSVAPEAIRKSVVAENGEAANLIFRVAEGSIEDLKGVVDGVETELVTTFTPPPQTRATPSGLAVVGVGLLENVTSNRTVLTYVALALVALWLLLRFRSPVKMLMAIVPVLMAVGTASLVVAAAGFRLSPLTTISGPLVIATCTGFASLILARYLEERERGLSPEAASAQAGARTGKAFVTSALTTVGGFAVLMFSALPLLRDFGAIVALNVGVALLAALVVQPPLLVWADRKGWLGTSGKSVSETPSHAGVDI